MKALRLPALPRPTLALRAHTPLSRLPQPSLSQKHAFLTLPSAPLQTIHATRRLPYPAPALYAIIADIGSYASFVPYCTSSAVTAWSAPDRAGRAWPAEAELRVGWRGVEEAFRSRVACEAGRAVRSEADGRDAGPFERLRSTWCLRAVGAAELATEVELAVEFRFRNPLYGAVSLAAADGVAGLLVEAFEKRARSMLGPPREADAEVWREGAVKM